MWGNIDTEATFRLSSAGGTFLPLFTLFIGVKYPFEDYKPANLMFKKSHERFWPKMADFSIAFRFVFFQYFCLRTNSIFRPNHCRVLKNWFFEKNLLLFFAYFVEFGLVLNFEDFKNHIFEVLDVKMISKPCKNTRDDFKTYLRPYCQVIFILKTKMLEK